MPAPELHRTRVEKVVLHELGHSFGLSQEHRDDADCIMFDTNSIADIDRVRAGYAGSCLRHMLPYLRKDPAGAPHQLATEP